MTRPFMLPGFYQVRMVSQSYMVFHLGQFSNPSLSLRGLPSANEQGILLCFFLMLILYILHLFIMYLSEEDSNSIKGLTKVRLATLSAENPCVKASRQRSLIKPYLRYVIYAQISSLPNNTPALDIREMFSGQIITRPSSKKLSTE